MWPWTRRTTAAAPRAEAPTTGTRTPSEPSPEYAALTLLTRRIDEIERSVKQIDTEWTEWFDKFRRLYARIAKRQERDETDEQSSQDAPGPTNGQEPHWDPSPAVGPGTAHLSRRFRGI